MRLRSIGPKLLCAFLLLFLTSTLAFAQVTVGCPGGTPGAFTSLNSAIFASPDHSSFLVSGTCTESVVIQNRNALTFFGNPSATIQSADPSIESMDISTSSSIVFSNGFTFTGGQGVLIADSRNVFLFGITVQNSGQFGITSSNSTVNLAHSTVTASVRTGIVLTGGTFNLGGGNNVSNNGRLGISGDAARLQMNDDGTPNIVSHNPISGVQLFDNSTGEFNGDNEITSNGGQFGLLVLNNSAVVVTGGLINGNSGVGAHCDGTTHCEFSGTQINTNGAGGVEIVNHSDASFDGGITVSGNTGAGVLVDQSSSLTSLGGNTISNNTGDGLILNFLSALNFVANDTITATAGNLALNCNNGSLVRGDISTYKPKKCGAAFQVVPIH